MGKVLFSLIVLLAVTFFSMDAIGQSKNMDLQANWNGANNSYNDVWGYVDYTGNEYAIIGSKTKVHFLNVSTPTTPILIKEFTLGSNTSWRDFKTYSHYAYAVSEGISKEGLVIFDLCDIEAGNIDKIYQQNDVFGKAHNIFIDTKNGLLYVVGSDTGYNGVIVYDLKEHPNEPTLIGNIPLPGGYIHDLFVKDNLAFCSHGYNGLYIYDFTDPANPIIKSTVPTGGYNHSSWGLTDENLLIYAQEVPTGLPLGVLDYTDYEINEVETIHTFKQPLLGNTDTSNTAHNPYIVGDYAIVSYYEDGVVIFDMSNPTNPDTVAYFDTYDNEIYNGYYGCWGAYPFLPSGNILASDISNGLFILKPTFDLTTTCNNGIQDWNEYNVDCGGICQLCTPCLEEICNNGIDDDRDGKTDCQDESCDCPGSQTKIYLTVMLEGFFQESSNSMSTDLVSAELLPLFQPFKTAPYYYEGREKIVSIPQNVVDWVLLEARHPDQLDSVLARKAALLLENGTIVQTNGTLGIQFDEISATDIHVVVRHKGHLSIMSSHLINLANATASYNFSDAEGKALGGAQTKLVGNRYCQYAGDFDQNGIINNQDYNIWKRNSALLDRYLFWDVDGNGVINILDANFWTINRSKIGEPMIHLPTLNE